MTRNIFQHRNAQLTNKTKEKADEHKQHMTCSADICLSSVTTPVSAYQSQK